MGVQCDVPARLGRDEDRAGHPVGAGTVLDREAAESVGAATVAAHVREPEPIAACRVAAVLELLQVVR